MRTFHLDGATAAAARRSYGERSMKKEKEARAVCSGSRLRRGLLHIFCFHIAFCSSVFWECLCVIGNFYYVVESQIYRRLINQLNKSFRSENINLWNNK